MNREIARNMDTNHIPVQRLCALLETFALKHSSKQIADLLEKAENEEASYRQFLLNVLETEVRGRNERRRKRNYSAAHFPPNAHTLEEFNPAELESGMTGSQVKQLKELTCLIPVVILSLPGHLALARP